MPTPTPFIYDRPVRGDEFVNRERELRSIFNGLRLGESYAISGAPRLGKTSLLLRLNDEITQREYLGVSVKQFVFVLRSLHDSSSDYTPATFWKEALQKLQAYPSSIGHLVEQAATEGYSYWALERLFNHLRQQGLRLVLLLDEFERLLIHTHFQYPTFFARLRSLATLTGGLAVVFTSRLDLTAINEISRHVRLTVSSVRVSFASPPFNHMNEVSPGPFDKETVARLLDRGGFDLQERRFIRRLAGHHPFLLQAMAATLFETTAPESAAERFYERVAFHFDELWYTLDDPTRTTAIILSLLELSRGTNTVSLQDEIKRVDIFGPELDQLARLGLAQRVEINDSLPHFYVWRGEQWRVGTQAFVWWVWDVIIAKKRELFTIDEWLSDKQYRVLLPSAQWDKFVSSVANAPQCSIINAQGVVHTRRQSPV